MYSIQTLVATTHVRYLEHPVCLLCVLFNRIPLWPANPEPLWCGYVKWRGQMREQGLQCHWLRSEMGNRQGCDAPVTRECVGSRGSAGVLDPCKGQKNAFRTIEDKKVCIPIKFHEHIITAITITTLRPNGTRCECWGYLRRGVVGNSCGDWTSFPHTHIHFHCRFGQIAFPRLVVSQWLL